MRCHCESAKFHLPKTHELAVLIHGPDEHLGRRVVPVQILGRLRPQVVEITGKDGRISWDYDSINGGALHLVNEVRRFDPLGERGYAREIDAFLDAVRHGGPSPVPVADGVAAARTALAALHSVRTGQPVDLTTWGRS